MKRYKIIHKTRYHFSEPVELLPHTLRLRPRESHELRIEHSVIDVSPSASIRWHRDAEDNSVAIATFSERTTQLSINSEIIIQHYDILPYDFIVENHAVNYPFVYQGEDSILLTPYMTGMWNNANTVVGNWVSQLWQLGEKLQTVELLSRLNQLVYQTVSYQQREEEGVQSPEYTLGNCLGSCRDSAALFMVAARQLGMASRFVSGYLYSEPTIPQSGATHAWAEVFIPGAGWKGFDPTTGMIVGSDHITVAVARLPESVPPVAGQYLGQTNAKMHVDVRVTDVTDK